MLGEGFPGLGTTSDLRELTRVPKQCNCSLLQAGGQLPKLDALPSGYARFPQTIHGTQGVDSSVDVGYQAVTR